MANHFSAQNLFEHTPLDKEFAYASVRNTLEQARFHVKRAINPTMLEAYEDNMALLSGVPNLRHAMS